MENNCLNCGQIIIGNYCSNCGQKKYRRIDRKYIIEEAQYSLLHTNKGFLYSVKNILKNPGKTAREFIDGNRVNHYKPILLAFVLSGISAFISIKLIGIYKVMENMTVNGKAVNSPQMHEIMSYVTSYNSFIALLMIPFFALLTKSLFYKWGNNYYEHVVMNAFFQSYYTIIYILILYPIMYFLKGNPDWILTMMSIAFMILPFLLIWFFKGFYENRKLSTIILRVIAMFVIFGVLYFGVILIAIVINLMLNPEAIQQIHQKT